MTKKTPSWRKIVQTAVTVLSDMYAFYLSLLIILWLATGERFFFVNIFVSLVPGIFYFLPVVLLIAIIRQRRFTFACLVIPVITFFIWYGNIFLPKSTETTEGFPLTVLAYNLRQDNENYAELKAILQEAAADMVSLEEVNRNMIPQIEEEWSASYPYRISFIKEESIWDYSGRVLLSRYPITDYEYNFSELGMITFIHANIKIGERELAVYNVHLSPPLPIDVFSTQSRSQGMNRLLASAAKHDTVLMMGDFNMSDRSGDYQHISNLYQDVFRQSERGFGTTFPNGKSWNSALIFVPSLIRIDYVFTSADISPIEAHVIRQGVSDHFPLWAKLSLSDL